MSQQLTPSQCIDLIKSHSFAVQKKLGQNFLIDTNILSAIVDAAEVGPEDCVLEIGPGMGALTGHLLERAAKVIAVEVDKMLIPVLEGTLGSNDKLHLINNDILKVDIAKLIEEENDGHPIKVVANLPYYITTPIVMELLEKEHNIADITVTVQKEVAQRMTEGPGSKAYGALSLAVQYYSRPKLVMNVSKHCFYPKPDVDSAVIKLDIYRPEERPVKVDDTAMLFKVIRAAFEQRRKTVVNALGNAGNLSYSKAQVCQALKAIGKSETIRGETLTLEEFARLSDVLQKLHRNKTC
ncbi:MAG: 16S rRNA (adenine(1518)-N(6)/adenine(1519)-N(6))-dimethyltransferase RsmA [Lachnospiraceae bacterium]|jgi:16S rRNA (adenine1518-N6/adenine1519-N6)-dimethyltransferase